MIAQVDNTTAAEDTGRYTTFPSDIDQSSESIPLFDITVDPLDSQSHTVTFDVSVDEVDQ